MIIFYELAFIILGIVIVVFCARPLVEAYSDKIKTNNRIAMPKPGELEQKVLQLEAEVMELKQQLRSVQESTDFALSLIEKKDSEKSNIIELEDTVAKKANS